MVEYDADLRGYSIPVEPTASTALLDAIDHFEQIKDVENTKNATEALVSHPNIPPWWTERSFSGVGNYC